MIDQSMIDTLRNKPVHAQQHFINGMWVKAHKGERFDVISPIDGNKFTTIANGTKEDVDNAVSAAKTSFDNGTWSRLAPAQRKKIMLRIADLIEENTLDLAVLGVRDNGTEIAMAIKAEPGSAAATFRYYGETIDKIYGEVAPTADNILALVHREPVGVVAVIVPWNFPLMIGAWKIAAALAAGNSVVLKPAELASLSLLRLAEICTEAGLPDGVLNVVTGTGEAVGAPLALHMDVDVIAFTGSGIVGRKLMKYAAESNLKRVYLELGGKSPNIVFADAPNLDQAAKVAAFGVFRNSGQVCVAGSRLLVEKSIHKEFAQKVADIAKSFNIGDPLDLKTETGAIISLDQLNQNLSYANAAGNEGATLLAGGDITLNETGGFYMLPTVFDNVSPNMSLANEEVFGPVLGIIPFENEDEAVSIANSTVYALAAAIWTSDLSRAHRMIKAVNAGVVHVNTYGGPDITVPLGGHGQSGNGYDKSLHALDKYTNLKTAWIQL